MSLTGPTVLREVTGAVSQRHRRGPSLSFPPSTPKGEAKGDNDSISFFEGGDSKFADAAAGSVPVFSPSCGGSRGLGATPRLKTIKSMGALLSN